jgi:hypothetical protein
MRKNARRFLSLLIFAAGLVPAAALAVEQSPMAALSSGGNSKTATFPEFGFADDAVRLDGVTVVLRKFGTTGVQVNGKISQFRCSQWHTGDLDLVLYKGDTLLVDLPKVYTMGDRCTVCDDLTNQTFYADLKDISMFDQADHARLVSRNFQVCKP